MGTFTVAQQWPVSKFNFLMYYVFVYTVVPYSSSDVYFFGAEVDCYARGEAIRSMAQKVTVESSKMLFF